MDKEHVVGIQGILSDHKKERNPAIFDDVDEPEEHVLSEQS